MFKNIIYRVLLFFISIGLLSCKTNQNAQVDGSCPSKEIENNHSLLWEITGNGLSEATYLFGTIHIIAEEDFFLGNGLECRFENTDTLVMELDMNIKSLMQAQSATLLPNGQTLSDVLPAEVYTKLRKVAVDSFEIKEAAFDMSFDKMKPIFAWQGVMISQLQENSKSYEFELSDMARAAEKPILGLETAVEQVGFFDNIPMEKQIEMIAEGLEDLGEDSDELDQMMETYKEQKVFEMYEDFLASSPEFAEYEDLLIIDRNKRWVVKLNEWMPRSSLFVAVGAGHLGGDEGLINLLKAEGYKVRPVTMGE